MTATGRWIAVGGALVALAGCFGDLNNQSDTDTPILQILSPAQADTVRGLVTFQVNAVDAGGIDVVKFYADDVLLTTDLRAPYQTVWNTATVSKGPHSLKAEAKDLAGNQASQTIVVIVDNTRN